MVALVIISVLWAGFISWAFKQTPQQDFPKIDAIAFYTAGKLSQAGEWEALYSASTKQQTVEMDSPAQGVLPGSPSVFQLIRVETSPRYKAAAQESGFPDSNPPAFVYLPIYAVIFQLLSAFPWSWASYIWDLLNLSIFACGLGIAAFASLPSKPKYAGAFFLCTLTLLPLAHPFRFSLFCGQVTPMIVGLSCLLMLPKNHKFFGVLIGALVCVVGLMKILPGLLVLPLVLLNDRFRVLGFALAGGMLVLGSLIVADFSTHRWMNSSAQALVEGLRHWSGNQSLDAFVHRFFYSTNLTQMPGTSVNPQPFWVLVAIIKIFGFSLLSWLTWKNQCLPASRPIIIGAFILTLALLPHLSWSHYGLYALPLMFALAGALFVEPVVNSNSTRLLFCVLMCCILLGWGINPDSAKAMIPAFKPYLGEVGALTLYRVGVGAPFISMAVLFGLGLWILRPKKSTTRSAYS